MIQASSDRADLLSVGGERNSVIWSVHLSVETGSLYPCVHRLEARGWIAASWDLSDKGKRAKYYRLTTLGRKQLFAEQSKWEAFARAMGLILDASGQEG